MLLFALLALDFAGYAHGDIGADAAAIIALIIGIVALVLGAGPFVRQHAP